MKEEILEVYLDSYENKVQSMYSHISEHYDEAFPVLRFKDYLNIAQFNVDKDVFGAEKLFVIFDNAEELAKDYHLEKISDGLMRNLVDVEKHQRFDKLLELEYPEILKRKVIKFIKVYGPLYNRAGTLNRHNIELPANTEVENDYRNWRKENKTAVSKFNHDNISSYSHLDYVTLVKKFKSDIFKNDFEYQMNQAEECYKRHLYLPAAATLSVALETVLADLCKKEKIKITNSTEMNYLGEKLVERGIINYRLGKRIDITYSLRNSLAHTNRGEVAKDDCSIILSCIRTIIEEHY